MAVPVEEAIAALSTFSLEDDQPEVQGAAVWVCADRGATISPIEYSDVSAYRLSLSEDTKALNQLNMLIQEGKEKASLLYTYRSCIKALPQLPDSMKHSQAELYLETYQVLDLEMSRLRDIQQWQASAASKLAADMQRFSRPERRINGPTVTHLWSMLKLLDVLVQLDHLKNAKASIPNDFSWYKRTFTQVSVQWQDTDSMREELDDLQIFLSTRWAILLNSHVEMFRVNNVEDILQALIVFAVESLELDFALLFPERHLLLRVLPVLIVLATTSEKDTEALYKRVTINRLINIFKSDPLIPAFPDLHLSPVAIMKELSVYFPKFASQTRLLALPSPHELQPREIQDYQRQYLIVNHIGAIRAEHDDFAIRFALCINQLDLLKSTESADVEWCKDVKGNMYDMVVEGFQLLSRWGGRIWEQCAWKFSRPCKDQASEESNNASTLYSDYEKVVRYNYNTEERRALVELIGYVKSIGSMMQKYDTLVADALWETIHAEVQDFVQNTLATMLRTSFRRKKDLSRILSDMRTLSADWMANTSKQEGDLQTSHQEFEDSRGSHLYPRPVAPTPAQVHCLQFLIYEVVSGGNLRRPRGLFNNNGSEIPAEDLKQLETFFYKLGFFLHILDYKVTIASLTDLGFLWFREFYLETSRVIQDKRAGELGTTMTEPSEPTSPNTCPSTNRVEEFFVNLDDVMDIEEENEPQVMEDEPEPHSNSTKDVLVEEAPPHPFKRGRKAAVWKDFSDPALVKGIWKSKCKYCDTALSHFKSGATTHFNRHSNKCAKKAMFSKRQKLINFLPSNSTTSASQTTFVSALHDGQLDMSVMREGIAHWILMHEHPFRIVEEEGFNLMMKRGIPQYKSMSRHTIRSDSFNVYENEKKKLKLLLKGVEKISLTTDLWKSKPQKIEYMVLTGHFVDSEWKLQKRVLNFVHLPPPRKGRDIANCIFKCLKEWDIENKVFTISVDNASANDTCIQVLKDTFSLTKRLICGGKLFHVRCCAHILNIMVQHGLKKVKTIKANVHDSVDYINQSDSRLQKFTELVQQFNLKERRLVLECKTRWNSTYEMLACAIKFKKVFARLAQEDPRYTYCPSEEDWAKIEKLIEILEVFNDTTNIISGSEYPTSNLFLAEIYRIKVLLDKNSESSDAFVKGLVENMKQRFDKYWGECNLLMAIGSVLDPRLKMKVVEITFKKMFPSDEVRDNINKVKDTLYELYKEYVTMYSPKGQSDEGESSSSASVRSNTPGLSELLRAVRSEDTIESRKSEIDDYLDEGCYVPQEDECFDALQWWKDKSMKFRILSKLAADILAVPITTVASEATFSAGSRVIDSYRASLKMDTVQMLLCTGDWCRSLHGLKRKNKNKIEDQPKEIRLPLPCSDETHEAMRDGP